MQNPTIQEEVSSRSYFTISEHIIEELDLDPYAYRLYCHYKKVAGSPQGSCYQSKKTISEITKMSPTTIKEKNIILSKPFEKLGGKSLIKIIDRKKENGDPDTNLVLVMDIMPDNIKILSGRFSGDRGGGGSPNDRGVGRQTAEGRSPNGHKEDTIKEDLLFNKTTTTTTKPPPKNPVAELKSEDGGGGGGFENSKDLFYKTPKGIISKISQSDIFAYFLKHDVPTPIVLEAIEIARHSTDLISSIFRYLEAICLRLMKEKQSPKKKQQQLQEKQEPDILPQLPKKPKTTMGEYAKKHNPVLAKMLGVI